MTHDDALLDQIGVLALGALPAAEAALLRAHIAGCPQCRQEYAALRATADLVGYAAEMPPLDELAERRMKSRVMHAVRASAASDAPPSLPGPISGAGPRPHSVPPPSPSLPWLRYAAVAAALIALLAFGADYLTLRSQLTAERAHALAVKRQLDDLYASDSVHFAVNGGEVIRRGDRLYLTMYRMPKLAPGRIFQLWTLKKGAKAVEPSVTFTAGASGGAVVALPVPAGEIAAIALSQEPLGGSQAPTTTPAFVRKLS